LARFQNWRSTQKAFSVASAAVSSGSGVPRRLVGILEVGRTTLEDEQVGVSLDFPARVDLDDEQDVVQSVDASFGGATATQYAKRGKTAKGTSTHRIMV